MNITEFNSVLQTIIAEQPSMFHMASDALNGYCIHVENPNADPNNPKAFYYDLKVTEHMDPKGLGSLSHEVDASGHESAAGDPGVWLQGDQDGAAFGNDGWEGEPGWNDCHGSPDWSEWTHSSSQNLGHFSPTNEYKHHANGRSYNDLFQGSQRDDVLEGKTGNDTLFGNGGNDALFGGEGSDELHGGDGIDFLIGGAGNDVLYGEAHDDYLEGGAGDDTLYGGAGNDMYIFSNADGVDEVYEEGSDEDTIDYVNFADASDLWVFKLGADMILSVDATMNNYVFIKDYDVNRGLDYIYLGGLPGAYLASDAWAIAADLGAASAATFMSLGQEGLDASGWASITQLETVEVDLAGVPSVADDALMSAA